MHIYYETILTKILSMKLSKLLYNPWCVWYDHVSQILGECYSNQALRECTTKTTCRCYLWIRVHCLYKLLDSSIPFIRSQSSVHSQILTHKQAAEWRKHVRMIVEYNYDCVAMYMYCTRLTVTAHVICQLFSTVLISSN